MVLEKDFILKYSDAQKKVSKIQVPPPTPSGKDDNGKPIFEPKDFESGMDKFAEETAKIVAPIIYKFTEEKSIEIAQTISQENDGPIIERLSKLMKEFEDLKTENEQLRIRIEDLETTVNGLI